jgi:hypothetical protein
LPLTLPALTTCGCAHFGQVSMLPPNRSGDDEYDREE